MPENADSQSAHTPAGTGTGEPTDAPTPRYTDADMNAIVAKKATAAERNGAERARAELLASLGVEHADALRELVEIGRKAKPAEKPESERLAEKIRAESAAKEAALAAEIAALKSERERSLIRDKVRGALDKLPLHDQGREIVMAALGFGEMPKFKATDTGEVVILDKDGDPVATTIEKWAEGFAKERQFLVRSSGTPTVRTEGSGNGKSGKLKPEDYSTPEARRALIAEQYARVRSAAK